MFDSAWNLVAAPITSTRWAGPPLPADERARLEALILASLQAHTPLEQVNPAAQFALDVQLVRQPGPDGLQVYGLQDVIVGCVQFPAPSQTLLEVATPFEQEAAPQVVPAGALALTHVPLTQLVVRQPVDGGQVIPQPPQFPVLLLVSTQTPVHRVWPLAQALQVPLTHMLPEGQALPQVPQFATSLLVLTQTPLQRVCPLGQVTGHVQGMATQRPARHTSLAVQVVPQPPQLTGSALKSRQRPLHGVSPGGHEGGLAAASAGDASSVATVAAPPKAAKIRPSSRRRLTAGVCAICRARSSRRSSVTVLLRLRLTGVARQPCGRLSVDRTRPARQRRPLR